MRTGGWGERFQEAALNPSLWMTVLQEVADATGSARGQLIGMGSREAVPFNWVTSFAAEALEDFVRIGGTSPLVSFRVAADSEIRPGEIAHEVHYARARTKLKSDVYVGFCHDNEIPYGCQTALLAGDGALIGLATLRTERDGKTTDRQRAIFASAASAARDGVRLQLALEGQAAALAQGALDATLGCHMLLDGNGRVRTVSASAEQFIARGNPLSLVDQQLTGSNSGKTREIALELGKVLGGTAHRRIAIANGIMLDLFALQPREWTLSFAPRVVAVIRDRRAEHRTQVNAAAALYGLSVAECEVVAMLTAGMSREAISLARGTSAHTLKSQIRSIYQKTGCTREVEVAALVGALR